MYYYDPNDRAPRRWGAIAAALYLLLLAAAFAWVQFDFGADEPRPGEGMWIDFGEAVAAAGEREPMVTDAAAAQPEVPAAADQPEDEVVTADESDVAVAPPVPAKPKPEPAPAETKPEEQPRTVNRRALFPGSSTDNPKATSEGPAETGRGNAGDPSGSPQGSREGTGHSDAGISYDLAGRAVVGSLPVPAYTANAAGKVIVDVTVDASGRVTAATYRPQGSTTNNAELVAAACQAARQARFTESESFVQGGTITYIFKLN